MYFYSKHLYGGIYYSEEELSWEKLRCEECGDSDWPLGNYNSFHSAWERLKDECDIDNSGGYPLYHVFSVLCEAYDVYTGLKEDATQMEILREIRRIIILQSQKD